MNTEENIWEKYKGKTYSQREWQGQLQASWNIEEKIGREGKKKTRNGGGTIETKDIPTAGGKFECSRQWPLVDGNCHWRTTAMIFFTMNKKKSLNNLLFYFSYLTDNDSIHIVHRKNC